eukprot:1139847-Pelagomonas_calceolata.AAC.3
MAPNEHLPPSVGTPAFGPLEAAFSGQNDSQDFKDWGYEKWLAVPGSRAWLRMFIKRKVFTASHYIKELDLQPDSLAARCYGKKA